MYPEQERFFGNRGGKCLKGLFLCGILDSGIRIFGECSLFITPLKIIYYLYGFRRQGRVD